MDTLYRNLAVTLGFLFAGGASWTCAAAERDVQVERVTTISPFPRGLSMVDGTLYVLSRGRVRGAGGVSAAVADQAGTIFAVDPEVAEPITQAAVGDAVRHNGKAVALPTEPPFRLWDRTMDPPERDRFTDRPYCTLRYHPPSRSFYLCAFSGIDKRKSAEDRVAFSKNLTDALLRFDRRTQKWYEVERHDFRAGGSYPHHDPSVNAPPHGWLNGPDNCIALGNELYVVAKDNSVLVRYDLSGIVDDPEAPPPPGELVLGHRIRLRGGQEESFYGHSALAYHGGWLYVAFRTSSVILRFPIDEHDRLIEPIEGELVARFDPFDPRTLRSANLTDMSFDEQGSLYVVSAKPARIYRFTPDPRRVFDARDGRADAWFDLASATGNPGMKSENILCHGNWLYVTSGDGYAYQNGADGTVYRVRIDN